MRLPVASARIMPNVELFAEATPWIRFSLPPTTEVPISKPRTVPPVIVTPEWPASFEMPRSQIPSSKQDPAGTPSPPTVWPFRSSVMSSAPITIPLLGQLVRSLSSVVSVVMIAPQPNWATDAGAVVEPTAATTASVATTALVKAHVLCNRLFNVFPFEWIYRVLLAPAAGGATPPPYAAQCRGPKPRPRAIRLRTRHAIDRFIKWQMRQVSTRKMRREPSDRFSPTKASNWHEPASSRLRRHHTLPSFAKRWTRSPAADRLAGPGQERARSTAIPRRSRALPRAGVALQAAPGSGSKSQSSLAGRARPCSA